MCGRLLRSESRHCHDASACSKKVVFVGVPGAFTPTCHLKHLPSYVDDAEKFKQAGVDVVFVSG